MSDLFARAEWLPAVALGVAAVTLALAVATARGAMRVGRLLGPRAEPIVHRALRRDATLVAALVLCGVALLAPRFGERNERTLARGIDLVLLLDVSRSMDAADVPPSRLRRAQDIAADILARMATGDRAALAAFGDRGVLLTPLTPDADALLALLPSLDADLVAQRASSLGDGVRAALSAFESGSARPRVVLVLTDGEDPAGGAAGDDALVAALQRADTRLVAVALGDADGTTIPDHGIALRDDAGNVIRTRTNAPRLDALATASRGVRLVTDRFGAIDPDAAVAALRQDAGAAPGEWFERRVPAVHVMPFALLALLLLAAEARPSGGWRPSARAFATVACLVGICVPRALADAGTPASAETLAALEAAARANPGDGDVLLALGYARARAGLAAEAARALRAAALSSSDPSRAALAFFDLGVLALGRGEPGEARAAFFEALVRDPSDDQARFNLEWTLGQLARKAPDSAASPPPDERPTRPESGDPSAAAPQPAPTGTHDETPEREREAATSRGEQDDRQNARASTAQGPQSPSGATSPESDDAPSRAPIRLSADEARRLLDAVTEPRDRSRMQKKRADSNTTGKARARGVVW